MKRKLNAPIAFLILALFSLLFGAIAGLLGSIQYLTPDYLKAILPFSQMRELHVTSVVSWIVLAAIGCIYFYLPNAIRIKWKYANLPRWHFVLYVLTGVAILISLFSGKMGGREYMTFVPWLMIPIVLGWVLMAVNYLQSVAFKLRGWPVYMWMWATGLTFMVFHLCEANFYLFEHFRMNYIRDLSVQWKSYGSITGSWNMLVYGTAIFLMSKLKEDGTATSKTAFFFYFLGLTNLMLGWAHHIYPVPGESWIRGLAYAISMTEWIVLASMLTSWLRAVKKTDRKRIEFPYTFLLITDIWIFINVLIAVLMSIPAINHYTHGTHITVAHSMGTTIGINTSILFSSIMFIISKLDAKYLASKHKILTAGMITFNIALFVFLSSLFMAGITKGMMMHPDANHAAIMEAIKPFLTWFHYAGGILLVSFFMIAIPMLKPLLHNFWVQEK